MAKALTYVHDIDLRMQGIARALIVSGCALALALAGQVLPL